MAEDDEVLLPAEIRHRLRHAATAAIAEEAEELAAAGAWLESLSGRDLLRVDGLARQFRHEGPTLGAAQQWTRSVVHASDVSAGIASMHRDGHVRERAVRQLATSNSLLSDRMLSLRVDDHVAPVSELATSTLLARTSMDHAVRTMPVLHRFEERSRGVQANRAYVEQLVTQHGPERTWAGLRDASDRDLRRFAYGRSLDLSLITLADAVALLPRERDQAVRRMLARVVADQGDPSTIREILLRGRAAESRVLGLLRLEASDLATEDVRPLLADSSLLARMWARRRWQELAGNAAEECRALIQSAPTPSSQALAYLGLAEAGGQIDRAEILGLVRATEPALQKVGLQLLVAVARVDDLPEILVLVRSTHSQVARLASEVLAANLGLWTLNDVAHLRDDSDPQIRRRGWWLHRTRGGWESLIADLQILRDPDENLARLGQQPMAPMYLPPDNVQRETIESLLRDAEIKRDLKLDIAFAAGLADLTRELRSQPRWPTAVSDGPAASQHRDAWWRAIFRRRSYCPLPAEPGLHPERAETE